MKTKVYIEKPVEVQAVKVTKKMLKGIEYLDAPGMYRVDGIAFSVAAKLKPEAGGYIVFKQDGRIWYYSEEAFNDKYVKG